MHPRTGRRRNSGQRELADRTTEMGVNVRAGLDFTGLAGVKVGFGLDTTGLISFGMGVERSSSLAFAKRLVGSFNTGLIIFTPEVRCL